MECGWVVFVWTAAQFRAVTYVSDSHHSHVNSQQQQHVPLCLMQQYLTQTKSTDLLVDIMVEKQQQQQQYNNN